MNLFINHNMVHYHVCLTLTHKMVAARETGTKHSGIKVCWHILTEYDVINTVVKLLIDWAQRITQAQLTGSVSASSCTQFSSSSSLANSCLQRSRVMVGLRQIAGLLPTDLSRFNYARLYSEISQSEVRALLSSARLRSSHPSTVLLANLHSISISGILPGTLIHIQVTEAR